MAQRLLDIDVLAGRQRELIDEGLERPREGVATRGAQGARRYPKRHERRLEVEVRHEPRRELDGVDVGGILEGIAASYDREASWHDSDAEIKKRLPN